IARACAASVWGSNAADNMGKGFYISKAAGIAAIILCAGALSTIIGLSVVYSQEKDKNDNHILPTDGGMTSKPLITPAPSNEPWDKYRLPKSLVPDHYNVTLWPHLTPDVTTGLYVFTGESSVEFECVEETDLILIHSNKLNYTKLDNGHLARLSSVSEVKAPSIKSSWLQNVTQYLVLQLDGKLMKGHRYHLFSEFIGELADDLGGFYRSEYMEDGVKKVVATTQMQPTDARKAFPCFDEPAMKAIFYITLIHAHGTVALSNGEEKESSNVTIDGHDVQRTIFEPTEKMSTYLLAFIVSDFASIKNNIDGILIRIFARKPAIAAGQGEYALNITGPILKFFEKYYNSSYPLPKSVEVVGMESVSVGVLVLVDKDCFQRTDWQIFREAAVREGEVDLEDYTSGCPRLHQQVHRGRHQHQDSNRISEPETLAECRRSRSLLKARDAAFRSGDRLALRAARRQLTAGVKRAKAAYAQRIQGHFMSNDPRTKHPSCLIVKFADDTAVVGRIADYRQEVEHVEGWCRQNNLCINVKKTKEMIVDFRRGRHLPSPLYIGGTAVEVVSSFRRLRRAGLGSSVLTSFYRCVVESVLSSCIIVWHGSCLAGREEGSGEGGEGCTEDYQIALPDFNAGAMENWGLITYRETALLYDEAFSSNSNKQRIATIIAHELAHMWFGNLVTLRWWNDLWLNEGFASYVEYLGAHEAEPDWNVKDLIVLSDVHRVFAVDALASSHPLSSKEEDIQRPAQISELFDAISYSKGASVLRMLSDFLTEEVFTMGLRTYLAEFAFGNAVYTDLWKHLQMAVDANGTKLPDTVHNIMNTWVLQMGFPVVSINTTTGVVTQEHFILDTDSVVTSSSPFNYQWIVPIQWMKTNITQKIQWLKEKSATIEDMRASGADWVLANIGVVGYYRVNYDHGNWDRLLKTLNTSHQIIPVINRAQLVDDAFNLARAKIIPTILALKTTKYLNSEREYMPWESALSNLDFFYLMFDRSEVYGPMQDYLRKQVTPLFEYFKTKTDNWSNVPLGHMDQYNQVNAISLACKTGLEECQNLAKAWFKQWMDSKINLIHPNLRSTVYCNAIAAGGAKEWEFAWSQFENATIAIEADKLRSALACTKEPWLLNRYLEYTLDPDMIRKQDATSTIVYIASNVVGQSLAWDFVRDRWSYIFTQYGGGSFSFASLINGVTKRFSTEFELQQLRQFKADNAETGFGSGTLAVDQSIERTIANINWITKNKQDVLDWFKAEANP
ncbi:hypothetical protein L3Q82_024374, partial [Scortum barcoo]